MKEFVEKLIERLGGLKTGYEDYPRKIIQVYADDKIDSAMKIVKELAEEYASDTNDGSNLSGTLTGWIPCSDRFPGTDEYILLSFENFSIPVVGRYEEDEEGGAFYAGDEDESCVKQGLFVNAWMPLPEPYSVSTSQNLATEQKKIPVNHYIERFNRMI